MTRDEQRILKRVIFGVLILANLWVWTDNLRVWVAK